MIGRRPRRRQRRANTKACGRRGYQFRTVVTIGDRLAFEYVDYAGSAHEMRCIAIDRDKHNIILGATVSVLDASGALTSVDGEASAWASGRFAHLEMRRSMYSSTPSLILLLARGIPMTRRDDFLSEVFDEVETAREQGLPVGRRYASIVMRTLPFETWQRVHAARQPRTDAS